MTIPALKSPLHFIGIGGVGMAPLALLARRKGWQVSGSDRQASANTALLVHAGIPISFDHSDHHLLAKAATVVVSSAIPAANPELLAAQQRGLGVCHRADVLAAFLNAAYGITVAGTHGKTTTTAMTAFLLEAMGCDPQAVIGGTLADRASSVLAGSGPYLVAEADESDGTFLKYQPELALVTNIAPDHLDFYGNAANLVAAFTRYVGNLKAGGTAIISLTSPLSATLAKELRATSTRLLTYGLTPEADLAAERIRVHEGYTSFTLRQTGKPPLPCRLKALGGHNVANALGALAVVASLGLDLTEAAAFLGNFPGVKRRLSLVYEGQRCLVVDDYAHNPGKIEAALAAVRQGWTGRRLIVVFQAHRFSRLRTMYYDFMHAFRLADVVVCLPVYGAGEPDDPAYSPSSLAADIAVHAKAQTFAASSFDEALAYLQKTNLSNTVILTLGAGDVTAFARLLRDKLVDEDNR